MRRPQGTGAGWRGRPPIPGPRATAHDDPYTASPSPTPSGRSSTSVRCARDRRSRTRSTEAWSPGGSRVARASSGCSTRSLDRAAAGAACCGRSSTSGRSARRRPTGCSSRSMARLLRTYGFPPAAFQYWVPAARAEVDFAYPDRRLGHRGRRLRGARHAAGDDLGPRHVTTASLAAGWTVVRYTWPDVVRRPARGRRRPPSRLGSDCPGRRVIHPPKRGVGSYQPRRSRSQTSITSSSRARKRRSW